MAPSATNDLAFTQSMYNALEVLKGTENLTISVSANEYVVSQAADIIEEYAHEGYNLIIAHGSQYGSIIEAAGPQVPEGLLRLGDRRLDVRLEERLRLRGQLERGWLRAGLHGCSVEQVQGARYLRADRDR